MCLQHWFSSELRSGQAAFAALWSGAEAWDTLASCLCGELSRCQSCASEANWHHSCAAKCSHCFHCRLCWSVGPAQRRWGDRLGISSGVGRPLDTPGDAQHTVHCKAQCQCIQTWELLFLLLFFSLSYRLRNVSQARVWRLWYLSCTWPLCCPGPHQGVAFCFINPANLKMWNVLPEAVESCLLIPVL